jgi:hypothetical protein
VCMCDKDTFDVMIVCLSSYDLWNEMSEMSELPSVENIVYMGPEWYLMFFAQSR